MRKCRHRLPSIGHQNLSGLVDRAAVALTEITWKFRLRAGFLREDRMTLRCQRSRGLDVVDRSNLQGPRLRIGAILSLVRPPGVGKTSLGQSIARALGRKFADEPGRYAGWAEIRGHRRTYISAMPGHHHAVKRTGVRIRSLCSTEVDKIGSDWRGDPSSALLEVLDPQQEPSFRDHYLDGDFDLSRCFYLHRQHDGHNSGAPAGPDGNHRTRRLHGI